MGLFELKIAYLSGYFHLAIALSALLDLGQVIANRKNRVSWKNYCLEVKLSTEPRFRGASVDRSMRSR